MRRKFIVTDYGKDYGYGRYFVIAGSPHPFQEDAQLGTNRMESVKEMFEQWIKEGDNNG